jgi:cell division septal protein FtsQ
MRRTKKLKRPVNWAVPLWFAFGVSLAAGMWFSPLTAPRKVRVSGVLAEDEATVRQALQSISDTPWLRVNRHSLEEKVRLTADISAASFEGNVFGRGVLKVKYHEPAAIVDGPVPALLSTEGDIYAGKHKPAGLAHVQLPPDGDGPWSLLTNPLSARDVARLALDLKSRFPDTLWTINIDARSVIILSPSKGPRVELGTSERLEEKIDGLAKILSTRPDIVRSASLIVLTAPDQPVYKP